MWCVGTYSKGQLLLSLLPFHSKASPLQAPLLWELSLKLIQVRSQGGSGQSGASPGGPPGSSTPPLPPLLAALAGVSPAPSPAPGLDSAPRGLTTAVIEDVDEDESSTDSFWWHG